MNKKIAIIGGGNLGTAIAEGLIQSGFVAPDHILITKRNLSTLRHLEEKGALVSNDNAEALRFANLVVLAVKPFQVDDVLGAIQPLFDENRHVLVSVVTGVSTAHIHGIINKKISTVRAMPNTAVAIQQSMTCISARDITSEQ